MFFGKYVWNLKMFSAKYVWNLKMFVKTAYDSNSVFSHDSCPKIHLAPTNPCNFMRGSLRSLSLGC